MSKSSKAATKAKAKPGFKRTAGLKGKIKAGPPAKNKTPIYLIEQDIRRLVTVNDAITTLEELFATWSDPATVNLPRQRAPVGGSAFNLMGAA